MALPAFIKLKDDTVFYSGENEFLLFVPESYFDRRIAVVEGVYVELLGILNYAVNIKPGGSVAEKAVRTFYFPARFTTRPGRIEKVKDFQLTKNCREDFRIFHYTNNGEDEIISSIKVPQDIMDVEDFFRVFVVSGHILNTIPYDEFYKYFLDSIEISGNSYDLPAAEFGILISELCRDPVDINKPFRLGTAIDKDMCSYKPISVKDIPKLVSPFTSLTSENFDKAVVGAVMNQNNESTPLERVLMG